jgi:hypothetical protein
MTAFYTHLLAARITLQAFEEGKVQALPIEARIEVVDEPLDIWRKTKALGEALVSIL